MEENEKLNLEEWFKTLDITWKRIFKQEIDINRNPTLTDIEEIINLESIDCSGSYVISLEPLQYFKKIKKLDFSNTKIKKINKISECTSLEEINASNTEIKDITPLKKLINLKKLNISNTQVLSIDELKNIKEIIYLNTPIELKEIEQKAKERENEIVLDLLFLSAVEIVVISQQGSTSLIQRKLSLGYNRAGRIIDQLESTGIVGPFEGTSERRVYFQDIDSLNTHLSSLNIPMIKNSNIPVIKENEKTKTKKSFWKRLFS